MQCPLCGYTQPGPSPSCPACGREFITAVVAAPARNPRVRVSFIRIVVYAALAYGMVHYYGSWYGQYLDAEIERLESALLCRIIEHHKFMQEAMKQVDAAQDNRREF